MHKLFLYLIAALLIAGCGTPRATMTFPAVRIQDTTDTNAPVFLNLK